MPRKPRFVHPVRQVRTCLGHSQPAFARLVGCSAVAIQRIENGTLQLSTKLANSIMEATGADPVSLRAGLDARALDMLGHDYSRQSYESYKGVLPFNDDELRVLLRKLVQYCQLLLIASNRGSKFKSYVVNSAIQEALSKVADDFNLLSSIHSFLIENGSVDKRIYRVSDLRKFSAYARILGFKDNKRFKPDKRIPFSIPRGWMRDYYLVEKPVLPHGADRKLRDATYILDDERTIPETIREAVSQALYWEIIEFRTSFCDNPTR